MVLLDTSVLAYLIYPDAPAPIDPATGHPVSDCKERLEHFIQTHQKIKILVSTPTYAEFLVKAGPRQEEIMELFRKTSAIKVVPFDEACAVECAALEHEARIAGDKRAGSTADWQKVKFDRQILAVGLFHSVSAIYTDDKNLRGLASRAGLSAFGIADMPLPESSRQQKLDLQETASPSDAPFS
jgi:predicted nucleic acid-binding protein